MLSEHLQAMSVELWSEEGSSTSTVCLASLV